MSDSEGFNALFGVSEPAQGSGEIPASIPVEAQAQPETATTTETVETAQSEGQAEQSQSTPARGADGKFVKADEQPATEAGKTEPPLSRKELDGLLGTALAERDKRQKAEREADALKARLAEFESKAKPEGEAAPYVDPDVEARIAHAVRNAEFNFSEQLARQIKGNELVDKAKAWAQEQAAISPGFSVELQAQRDPYGFVLQRYEQAQLQAEMTPERIALMRGMTPERYAAFQAWEAAQAAQPETTGQAPAPQTEPTTEAAPARQASPIPPRSVASAPSSGGLAHVPVGDGQAFAGLFPS